MEWRRGPESQQKEEAKKQGLNLDGLARFNLGKRSTLRRELLKRRSARNDVVCKAAGSIDIDEFVGIDDR